MVAGAIAMLLLAFNAFVCATWSHFTDHPGWLIWQLIPGSLTVGFILTTSLSFRVLNPPLRFCYGLCAVYVGALNFLVFASLGCWLAAGVVRLAGWPVPGERIAGTFFTAALLVTFYGWVNASWIRITWINVKLPNLPETWQGRDIALLTDLHLGPLRSAAFVRRILARLTRLNPEAVLISGDMFDGSTVGLDNHLAPWKTFSTPRGTYFVGGNHDEFSERRIYLDAVTRAGIRVLNNEKLEVDGLQIVGVHDAESSHPATLRTVLQKLAIDRSVPSILIAHQPQNPRIAEEAGLSLQLSGHTHGGQFWPWNYVVRKMYGPFGSGLSRLGNLQVFTSNGTGTWGPPVRVGTRSEIVLIRLA